MTDDAAALGQRLRACRQSAELSQDELAERSGLSTRTLSNLERGRTRWPHPDSVRRLADALRLRGEARGDFLATADRRLLRNATASAVVVPDGHQARAGGGQIVPRQLPGPVRQFVGRDSEIAALTSLLDSAGSAPAALVISAIGGTAGVGKTALAIHWAHQVAGQFPDGQLYVNLRGYDPDEPVPASDALAGFLRALGVSGQDIPAEMSERAARFRSLLAGRRMLVLLDNAGQAEQVRPLLPGSPGCLTVVTSRDALAGLVARDGAVQLDLDPLPLAEAIELLRALIGTRVDGDLAAADVLAARCARLPLALRVAAEFAVNRPAASLARLAGELGDQQRLDLLDAGADPRTGIRSVFSWSYQNLDTEAAGLFRKLGLHPGLDLGLHAAVALTATTAGQARRVLDVLARGNLIEQAAPGRYAMHDLLRAYARELAGTEDSEEGQLAALTRLFDYYLYAAATAMDTLFPAELHRRPRIPPPATAVPPLASTAEARAWLDAELANLAAVAANAADRGWPRHIIALSATLPRYLAGSGHFSEAVVIHTRAIDAARTIGDRAAEATALSALSQIDLHYGDSHQATSKLQQAYALFCEAGDQAGQARALQNLATVESQQGRYQQAGEHHQQALQLYLATGIRAGAARALHGLGDVDLRMGRYQRADEHLQRALALCQETGDRVNEAYVLALLGDLSLRLSRYQDAAGRLERALSLFREAEDQTGEAWVLAHLGAAQLGQGHVQLAIGYHQQATMIARENEDQFGEAEALNGLGEAYLATQQPAEARAAHSRALDLASQSGDKSEQARARAGLARSHHAAGDPAQALDHWHEALALYDELGTPEADQIRAQLTAGNHGRQEP
jgi:tetratricopeptide (TPR) repeat protein/transcriptional regulator with XRE-family HTH domain